MKLSKNVISGEVYVQSNPIGHFRTQIVARGFLAQRKKGFTFLSVH